MLALRNVSGQHSARSRELDFTCAATGPADRMPRLDPGRFVQWCDRHVARLRPGLANFVASVTAWRNEEWQRQERERIAAGGPQPVPAVYGGFHFGSRPADLLDRFWRTGEVPPAPPRR